MPTEGRKPSPSDLTGRALELNDLLDYQAGAIVSRTLVDRKTATVTLFAFDEGQGLSEHTAPFDALVQVTQGRVEVTVSGKVMSVRAGQMGRLQAAMRRRLETSLMPANQPHALKAVARSKMLLTMIRS